MEYRQLGNTNEKVSILGFGAMRLPTVEGNNSQIDYKKSSEIFSYGIDNGINIIDTAYSFHANEVHGKAGNSEPFLGEFLETGYREKVYLQTKCPSWLINTEADLEKYLDHQLERLKTDYIDNYLLHGVNNENWQNYKNANVIEFLDNALSDGKIKHVGFSTHGTFETLLVLTMDYDKWEIGLTQMNYLDETYQTGIEGLDYLASMNIGTEVMEPLRGGRLVENIPDEIMKMWDTSEEKRSPLEWALQYLWDMENVNCVFSGMQSLEQVKANIEIASRSKANMISENDKRLIKDVATEYKQHKGNDCTSCGYCMPCPNGINIPHCFREYNIGNILNNPKASAMQYFTYFEDNALAHNCTLCGDCTSMCPQALNIPKEMKKVKSFFGEEFNHF